MPVDVVRHRVMDIENTMRELRRLVEKGFEDLSTDEVYSMRYNIVVLVGALFP